MAKATSETLYCNFCGKSQNEVRKLIAGPAVYICDDCADMCYAVAHDEPFPARLERVSAAVLLSWQSRLSQIIASLIAVHGEIEAANRGTSPALPPPDPALIVPMLDKEGDQ